MELKSIMELKATAQISKNNSHYLKMKTWCIVNIQNIGIKNPNPNAFKFLNLIFLKSKEKNTLFLISLFQILSN
jgi:hypothetical protein